MTGFRFTKQIFIVLTAVIVLGLLGIYQSAAEAQPATLSGRVIGINGEPLTEAAIALLYVKATENGAMDTLYDRSLYPFLRQQPAHFSEELRGKTPDEAKLRERPSFLKSETDSEGRFTFTGIATGMVQLMVLPMENDPAPQNVKPVPEIQTIKFGEVTFHPHDFSFFPPIGAITFAVKPGSAIKDVEVVIETRPKPKIQGRLVFKNGEPLADTTVKFDIGRLTLEWGGSAYSLSLHTDADGNFVSAISGPGTYALSVNHRGLSAMSAPFTVEADKPHETVVLTLNGDLADLSELSSQRPEGQQRNLPNVLGAWIVNPANGHAYKKIACDDWEDAQNQAAGEEAHLVTVTNEGEQIWLEAIFGSGPYWIGLTDVLKEGEWIWETGEPVTYTNWIEDDADEELLGEPPALFKAFGAKNRRQHQKQDEEDYVMMSPRWEGEIGKWYPANSKNARRRGRVQMAILEKDGMRSKVHGLPLSDIIPEDN